MSDQGDDPLPTRTYYESPAGSQNRPSLADAAATAGARQPNGTAPPSNRDKWLWALAATMLVGALIVFGARRLHNPPPNEAILQFDWSADERAGATLTVDGEPVEIPAQGAWTLACDAGDHVVSVVRPTMKATMTVTATEDQPVTVVPTWQPRASLVVQWPLDDRDEAALSLDGRIQVMAPKETVELPVAPGEHLLRVLRRGAPIYDISLTVAEDQHSPVTVSPSPPGTLMLNWPVNQREGASLTIDGRAVALDSDEPDLAFPLRPGRHRVVIGRQAAPALKLAPLVLSGAETRLSPLGSPGDPFESNPNSVASQPVDSAGAPDKVSLDSPSGIPADPFQSQPQEPDGDQPPTPAPIQKTDVPKAEELAAIAKRFDADYKIGPAADKNMALAARLLTKGTDATSPAERYWIYSRSADLATAAGQSELALKAVDKLGELFKIDAIDVKQQTLEKSLKSAVTAEQSSDAMFAAERLLKLAAEEDRFDQALAIAGIASRAANKPAVDAATRKAFVARIARWKRGVELLKQGFAAAEEARATLAKDSADPAACAVLGRWYCLQKGDWQRGLPLLAVSNDTKLRSLADRERASTEKPDDYVEAAGAWWDFAEKQPPELRDPIRLHAAAIYAAAAPQVKSGLTKEIAKTRVAEAAKIDPLIGLKTVSSVAVGLLPTNEWIELLPRVDPNRDTVLGTWTFDGPNLHVSGDGRNRLEIPVLVEGGYDLEVKFVRSMGTRDVNVIFPVGRHNCTLILSGFDGDRSGLSFINRHAIDAAENLIKVEPGRLENGKVYTATVKVRLVRDDFATVDVDLDGRRYLPHWEGNPAALRSHWEYIDRRRVTLATLDNEVTFHSARLKMISGEARPATSEHFQLSRKVGGAKGSRFLDIGPRESLLVGFRARAGKLLDQIEPLYRRQSVLSEGAIHGWNPTDPFEVVAKEGYAVGAIIVNTGEYVQGFRAVFMRIAGDRLDPDDAYESEWIGHGDETGTMLSGDGVAIVGIHGSSGAWIDSLGLVLANQSLLAPKAANEIFLDDLKEVDANTGYGKVGKHGAKGYDDPDEVLVSGAKPSHSLSAHPAELSVATVRYDLPSGYKTLCAQVALMDDAQPRSEAIFRVVADGKAIWASRPLGKAGDTTYCRVSIAGARQLQLEVECAGTNGNLHPVWVNPKLKQ